MERQADVFRQSDDTLPDAFFMHGNEDGTVLRFENGELNVNFLLEAVIRQAWALDIPVSMRIRPHVTINRRALRRLGQCKRSRYGEYEIELSDALLRGSCMACCETLAHEVLHTCPNCMNHQALWRAYAEQMNHTYGYQICRLGDSECLGVKEQDAMRYLVRCTVCGNQVGRMRRSQIVKYPERYRCGKCGGALAVLTADSGVTI